LKYYKTILKSLQLYTLQNDLEAMKHDIDTENDI